MYNFTVEGLQQRIIRKLEVTNVLFVLFTITKIQNSEKIAERCLFIIERDFDLISLK